MHGGGGGTLVGDGVTEPILQSCRFIQGTHLCSLEDQLYFWEISGLHLESGNLLLLGRILNVTAAESEV